MYRQLKDFALWLLKAPRRAPESPSGSHGSVQVFRASPRFLRYRLIVFWIASAITALAWVVGVGAALYSRQPLGLAIVLLASVALIVILFLAYFAVRIDYDMRYYIVTDRSLRVREGAWNVKEKTITYANVQNLHIVQGPLQRLFRIWSLRVDTAGGGAAQGRGEGGSSLHTVEMAGIENAVEVRDLILGYLRARTAGTGLGDPDELPVGASAAGRATAMPTGARTLESLRVLRETAAGLRAAAESLS